MPNEAEEILSRVTKYIGRRNAMIEELNAQLEEKVTAAQAELITSLLEDIAEQLDTDRGKIVNNDKNRRLLSSIDAAFDNFAAGPNLEVVRSMVIAGQTIVTFNANYAGIFSGKAPLIPITARVTSDLNTWLGIDDKKGTLRENGYLKKIVQADDIRNDVKQTTLRAVQSQQGYDTFKKELKTYIAGEKEANGSIRLGKLQQYYRNYAYDTYSQIDRAASNQFAESLDMKYAIFEGGLISTSRKFCIKHNGKVFTLDEIKAFKPTEAIPIGYNPLTDIGGFGCRHHYNWITYELAIVLRPDLKKAA